MSRWHPMLNLRLLLVVSHPRNSHPSPTLQSYLRDQSDARIPRRLALQSVLPSSSLYRAPDYHGAPRDVSRTSMMMTGSDRTWDSGTQDLAALTSASTRSTSESVPTSVGARQLESQRLLVSGPENVLLIPPLPTPRILECPFNTVYDCSMTYVEVEEWIKHSLKHFGHVGPSTSNVCCFCDVTFDGANGQQSWRERMQHVASHHRLGEKLAHARPDFQLFRYLWSNKLIDNAVYKDLKVESHGRARAAAAAYPSPPISPTERGVTSTQFHSHRHRNRR